MKINKSIRLVKVAISVVTFFLLGLAFGNNIFGDGKLFMTITWMACPLIIANFIIPNEPGE